MNNVMWSRGSDILMLLLSFVVPESVLCGTIVTVDNCRMFVYQLLKWTSGISTNEDREQHPDEEISEELATEFASACTYLPIVLGEGLISREDQLYFYARYKLITYGKAG